MRECNSSNNPMKWWIDLLSFFRIIRSIMRSTLIEKKLGQEEMKIIQHFLIMGIRAQWHEYLLGILKILFIISIIKQIQQKVTLFHMVSIKQGFEIFDKIQMDNEDWIMYLIPIFQIIQKLVMLMIRTLENDL